MKKILAGILFLFLVVGSCFAEFFVQYGETFAGYIVNCKAQTIEKVTLPYGTDLNKLGRFFYIEDSKIYDVRTHPDSWGKDKVTGKNITMWDRCEYEKESMRDAIIDYIKRVENFSKWDCSELLKKIETMKFEDD